MKVGSGSHLLEFSYSQDTLQVFAGADDIEWGYSLNVARFPTYTGEVVQILSCYVDDLTVTGSVQSYDDIRDFYSFFLRYINAASVGTIGEGNRYTQEAIKFTYPHRGWSFDIVPKSVPAYRLGRDVVVPQWRLAAFVRDTGDTEKLGDLITQEADIKDAIQTSDTKFNETFSIEGKIKFVGDNPFSDPWSTKGGDFDTERKKFYNDLADYYTSLLPAYMDGDFSALEGTGSKPSGISP